MAFCREWAERQAAPRLRHRRRRHQGRRPRSANRAWARRPSSRGGPRRTSFPPSRPRHGCGRSPSTSGARAPSRPTPCSSRSGSPARPSRWRRCTTSRRSRAATSGPGDMVIIEKGGDVIPKVVGRRPRRTSARRRAVGDALDVPVLRQHARQARGRSRLAVRKRVVPGPPAPEHPALRGSPGHEHRRPRRIARRSAGGSRPGARRRGSLRPDRGRSRGARSHGREVRAEAGRPDRGQQGQTRSGGSSSASAFATSANAAPRRWRRPSDRSRRSWPPICRRSRRCGTSGPWSRHPCGRTWTNRATWRCSSASAPPA